MEGFVWEVVGVGAEEWLVGGFLAAERMEVDLVLVEIHGGAHEPALPGGAYEEVVAEDGCHTALISSADEDDLTLERGMEIEAKARRHFLSRGGAIASGSARLVRGMDVAP